MSRKDLFDRVLLSLYDAVLDDARWPATAALLEKACGTRGTELIVGEGSGDDVRIHFARMYYRGQRRRDYEELYFEVYHPWDERIPRLRRLPDSRITPVRDLYTEEELKSSPAYNDGLRRAGAQNGLNVRMDAMGGGRIVWAFGDPLDANGWGSSQIEMIQRLLPHLRHFVQTRQTLATAQALNHSFGDLLDNTRMAVFHLDRRARINATNRPAQELLRSADGLYADAGHLHCRQPGDDARLGKLLAEALPRFGDTAIGGSMTARRSPTMPRLALHVSPVSPRQMHFGAWRVGALVIAVEPRTEHDIDQSVVGSTLGLTPAESRVAICLATGHSIGEIAQLMGRRQSSIRSHIKRVYSKQGISRQADLVRLVLSAAEFPKPLT